MKDFGRLRVSMKWNYGLGFRVPLMGFNTGSCCRGLGFKVGEFSVSGSSGCVKGC